MTCAGTLSCSLTPGRDDAYKLRTRALRRAADLEQLRAFPLAPPVTNGIDFTLLACLYALFQALFSGINAAAFPVGFLLAYRRGQDVSYKTSGTINLHGTIVTPVPLRRVDSATN